MNFPTWAKNHLDVYYARGKWFAADPMTGDRRDVDEFDCNIDTWVSADDQQWCRNHLEKWLHKKHGDGITAAIKKVPQDNSQAQGSDSLQYVKVWIGDPSGSEGQFR